MMNGFGAFLGDPKVHDTVLMTMVISSFLAAIRRIKQVTKWWHILWNFFYDWAIGFWSLKTGQPLHPLELHTESKEQTPSGTKTSESTLTSEVDSSPLTPPADPAKQK